MKNWSRISFNSIINLKSQHKAKITFFKKFHIKIDLNNNNNIIIIIT
jgi:hypothetical protein